MLIISPTVWSNDSRLLSISFSFSIASFFAFLITLSIDSFIAFFVLRVPVHPNTLSSPTVRRRRPAWSINDLSSSLVDYYFYLKTVENCYYIAYSIIMPKKRRFFREIACHYNQVHFRIIKNIKQYRGCHCCCYRGLAGSRGRAHTKHARSSFIRIQLDCARLRRVELNELVVRVFYQQLLRER